MTDDLGDLLQRVRSASGRDQRLDRDIARCLDTAAGEPGDPPSYTASIDACIGLIERLMPGWHWHVGYGPKGVMPYAFLSQGRIRREAIAATVPLALMIALLEARSTEKPT